MSKTILFLDPFRDFHQKKDWNGKWLPREIDTTKSHFGISIKRRIETFKQCRGLNKWPCPFRDFHQKKDWNTTLRCHWTDFRGPISGFPSKEGLKQCSYWRWVQAKNNPFRDFHQKKDWNRQLLRSQPWMQQNPFRDFHQKKDWNSLCALQMKSAYETHFGISIKRRIETSQLRI